MPYAGPPTRVVTEQDRVLLQEGVYCFLCGIWFMVGHVVTTCGHRVNGEMCRVVIHDLCRAAVRKGFDPAAR